MNNEVNITFSEKRKISARPFEHIIRIVVRILCVIALVFAAFSNWQWHIIIALGIVLGLSFLESKKEVSNSVQMIFDETSLTIKKDGLINEFGQATKSIYIFEYKTKPAVEYSTRDHTVTFRGNAIVQKFQCGNKYDKAEKMMKYTDGPTTLIVSAHEFDGDIVNLIHENSPLRVEKISC